MLLGIARAQFLSKAENNSELDFRYHRPTRLDNDVQRRSPLDLQDIDSITFLTPFLDIIRSDEISGPMTCLALNAVNKFLSYGLIGR